MDGRKFKTPEQLQIGEVIPVWGQDLIIEHTEQLGQEISPHVMKEFTRVTFEGGVVCDYPHGAVVAVVEQ